MTRLFLAVWPPGPVVEQLRALPRPEQPGVRWVRPETWHVTIRFLGDADPADVADRIRSTTLPAATAVLGPVVRRMARTTVVVPVAGLDPLAAVIGRATADIGEPTGPRLFQGHLTLARLRPRASCDLVGTRVAAEARVDEVVLVRSELTHEGATYHVIGRWPLGETARGDQQRRGIKDQRRS